MSEWGIALIGAGWISRQYAEALRGIDGARLIAVASRTPESARSLADEFDASLVATFDDLAPIFENPEIDVVCVNSPNHLHASHAIAASQAGKHVIVEKPLCNTFEEADRMAAAARQSGCGVGYAENLVFAPLFRHAKQLLEEGAIGRVLWSRQVEKHGGPYSPWFWRAHEAGGGALADMGCHGIECLRWLLGKPPVRRVHAHLSRLLHRERTALDDDALVRLDFDDGSYAVSESSWAVISGMQSTLEVHGTGGSLYADLLGTAGLESPGLRLFQPDSGWSEVTKNGVGDCGYVAELDHFLNCFRDGVEPEESLADGRAVLEILFGAYASAGRGSAVELPFDPGSILRPVELWTRG
ncbi:MAG: Gfo/Idh/MocA family oxidoreductase [bacterium]|nr:Gfo/Idh/MocA family oxidoreductase [bacterium]